MNNRCSRVILSSKAYLSIVAETYERFGTETGGILLGKRIGDVWYVIENLDPGPNSIFRSSYFEYDTPYVNHLANKIARFYKNEIELLGLWHRHPGSFDSFSSTDDGTNSKYASQSSFGAISGLVNLDPRLRLTMYHVSMPLKYDKVQVSIGDDLVPPHLLALKTIEDFLPSRQTVAAKQKPVTTAPKVVRSQPPKREREPSILENVVGALGKFADNVISLVKPSAPKRKPLPEKQEIVTQTKPTPTQSQDIVLDMLENEIEYLESQLEYDYAISMTAENEITVFLNYIQNMAEYPREIECVLKASNPNERYAILDGKNYSYKPDIVRWYVNNKVLEASGQTTN